LYFFNIICLNCCVVVVTGSVSYLVIGVVLFSIVPKLNTGAIFIPGCDTSCIGLISEYGIGIGVCETMSLGLYKSAFCAISISPFGPRNVIRLVPILTTLQIILESCFPPPRKSTFSPTFNSVSKEPFDSGVAGVPDANGGVFNGDGAYGGVSGAYGGVFNGDGA